MEPHDSRAAPVPAAAPGWRDRVVLAGLLHSLIDDDAPMPDGANWPSLIGLAAREQVTPTLAGLPHWERRAPALPRAVRDYFEAACFLNAERNALMLIALKRAVTALEAAGLRPVVLKGAANLVAGLYANPGARLMGDLDILIPETGLAAAAEVLAGAGFDAGDRGPRAWIPLRHHHAPMRRDLETGAGVELHDRIATVGDPVILEPEAVLRRSEIRKFETVEIRIPSPTDRLVHCIAHDQVNDRNALRARVGLKALLETALLANEAIDWEAARAAFPSGRWRDAFDRVCALAAAWLGAPVPREFCGNADTVVAWLRQGRSAPVQALSLALHRAGSLLRTQPLGLVNLLDPRWAAERLHRLLK